MKISDEGAALVAGPWRKSSRCIAPEHCVEVAFSSSVRVRDRAGSVIEVGPRSWQRFIDEIVQGGQS